MIINRCCITYLYPYASEDVRDFASLVIKCGDCKRRWKLKRDPKKSDGSSFPVISWELVEAGK